MKGFVENVAANKAMLTGFVNDNNDLEETNDKVVNSKNDLNGFVDNFSVNNRKLKGLVNDKSE